MSVTWEHLATTAALHAIPPTVLDHVWCWAATKGMINNAIATRAHSAPAGAAHVYSINVGCGDDKSVIAAILLSFPEVDAALSLLSMHSTPYVRNAGLSASMSDTIIVNDHITALFDKMGNKKNTL